MKVAHICVDDWANFMFQQHEALLSVGVDSVAYKIARHPFAYENQAELCLPNEIKEKIKDASHVIIYHSDIQLAAVTHQGQKVIVYHTGTKFRTSYKSILEESKSLHHLIALPEFNKLIDCSYIVGAVDTDKLISQKQISKPFVVGHYPSNANVKGSSLIIESLKDISGFQYDLNRVSYKDHLKRLDSCDIYIELFAPLQGANPYGSFGMTALEAAALGKIVITQNVTGKELYESAYGECGIITIDKIDELRAAVIDLISTDDEDIKELSQLAREWVVSKHGYKATGGRLYKFLREL